VRSELPAGFEIVLAAVVGAMIGSFLNVCILRWGVEPKQSVVHPRSRCPRCGRMLAWYDNIPVISWLLLRARCRGCGQPISAQYPLIELATAAIWAFMVWREGVTLEALHGAIFGTILLGIAMTDAREYLIPHEFSIGGTVIAIALSAWPDPSNAVASLQGALVGAGAVLLIGELSELALGQEAMGGGDCALMGMIGAFLGWEAILPVLLLGAVISTVIFLATGVWLRRDGGQLGETGAEASVEPSGALVESAPGFRWAMVVKLMALGTLPILLLAGSFALGVAGQVLGAVFHGVIGAGLAYYASFLLPASIENQTWVRVRGLLAAALAIAIAAGLSLPRIVVAVILGGAALWYARRVPLMPSPETTAGLHSQGYLPFGVGLTAAAAVLQFSGWMPLVRDVVAQYGQLLRFM
jgi:leader peptidase (prepilin peptidase)/N-methyltransferase